MKSSFILTIVFLVFDGLYSGAQEVERYPAQVIIQDKEIIEKAKSHNFRGGAEEGELRVRAQLPKAQRKIAPVIEKSDEEKESQDHD